MVIATASLTLFHATVLLSAHIWSSQMLFIKHYRQNIFNFSGTMVSRKLYDRMILEQLLLHTFLKALYKDNILLPCWRKPD